MVTHDADVAKQAHRIEFLRDGQIEKTKKKILKKLNGDDKK